MKLGVLPEAPENTIFRFREQQTLAQAAEAVGFDSYWVVDHLIFRFPNREDSGCWEALTLLGGLAASTTRITLGPLVSCASFRNPALLAKMADTLDEISEGRLILGLGAGWHEPEYTAFGYPFDHRAGRFEEYLQIVTPLLREGKVDFAGQYYQAREAELIPRGPTRRGPPILVAGKGPRMLELTARYADAWNTAWHTDPAKVAEAYGQLVAACERVGRDPATLELTVGIFAHVLAPGEQLRPDEKAITGTPEQVAEKLEEFAALGAGHLMIIPSPAGVGGIERFAPVIDLLKRT